MSRESELQSTIDALVQPGKGILAADESLNTITKRLKAVGVESTEESRRSYRSLLLSTEGIGEFLSGVILFEETLGQKSDEGVPLPEVAKRAGVVPGIKVDKGKVPMTNAPGDLITQGLDFLAERLQEYKAQGARFAKWREVYPITEQNPTWRGIEANAEVLARYAAICQEQGVVPIVEPEVLLDGDHTLQRCAEVTEWVQHAVFHALHRHGVKLEYMLLKPSMVLPGKESKQNADAEKVACETVKVLRRTVPGAVPSINFLSGGQSPEQATANLNAINSLFPSAPWQLSFSFARALQQPVMEAWQGKAKNIAHAQQLFLHRAKLNGAARSGHYSKKMEKMA